MKESWLEEYEARVERDLTGKRYVYLWADGIYFNVRLMRDRPCMLVVMGTTPEAKKRCGGNSRWGTGEQAELEGALAGPQATRPEGGSEAGGGRRGLGFWPALEEVDPGGGRSRDPGAAVLGAYDVERFEKAAEAPAEKRLQSGAKRKLREMQTAPTNREALGAFDDFMSQKRLMISTGCGHPRLSDGGGAAHG